MWAPWTSYRIHMSPLGWIAFLRDSYGDNTHVVEAFDPEAEEWVAFPEGGHIPEPARIPTGPAAKSEDAHNAILKAVFVAQRYCTADWLSDCEKETAR